MIELLVVIAIIAILAALLLPALSHAKDQARTIECLNDLKQLHLAWQMYDVDHGSLPRNWDYGSGFAPPRANWVAGGMSFETPIQSRPLSDATNSALLMDPEKTQLAPYLNSAGVFRCPADKSYAVRDGTRYPRVRSYSMNQHVGDPASERIGHVSRRPDGRKTYFYKSTDFTQASTSQIFVLLDEHQDSINDGYFLVGHPEDRTLGFNDVPAGRHRKAANFVFADGHAETHRWMDPRTIQPIKRTRLYGLYQSYNRDVAWIHDHAYRLKQLK